MLAVGVQLKLVDASKKNRLPFALVRGKRMLYPIKNCLLQLNKGVHSDDLSRLWTYIVPYDAQRCQNKMAEKRCNDCCLALSEV